MNKICPWCILNILEAVHDEAGDTRSACVMDQLLANGCLGPALSGEEAVVVGFSQEQGAGQSKDPHLLLWGVGITKLL